MTYIPTPSYDNSPDFRNIPDTLPINIQIEESVLGGCLLDQNAITRIVDIITPEAFYIQSHRDIFKAIVALYKQDKPTDLLSVVNYLADRDLLSKIGGQNKLTALVDRAVSAVNIDVHSDTLVEKYLRRKLISAASDIQIEAHDQDKPLAWVLEQIEQRVLQITQLRKHDGKSYWKKWDEVIFTRLCNDLDEVEAIENIAQRDWAMRKLAKKWKFGSKKELLDFHAKWLDSRSVTKTYSAREYFEKYGQSDQDWLIPGFIPTSSVVVLYADGGVGKTRLAFTLAKAATTGGQFAYEGTEFSPMNTLLIETDQGPRNTSKLLEMQDFLADEIVSQRFVICDEWSVGEFGRLKSMLKQHQPKLVIIDSLTSISVDSLYSENDAEYARPLVRLRHLAKEYNCTFLLIHHSNANGDMRGSKAIRNTVDEVYKFTKAQNEIGQFNILAIEKSRSRGPGAYKFTYNDETWGWTFGGRIEDDVMGGNGNGTSNMTRCLQFLQTHSGMPFEVAEVAEELRIAESSVRRDLKRAAAEGLCNTGRSNRNSRALVYYVGARVANPTKDQVITGPIGSVIEKKDEFSKLSSPSDQVINPIGQIDSSKVFEDTPKDRSLDHLEEKTASKEDTAINTEVISQVITSTDQTDHFATSLNNSPPHLTVVNKESPTLEQHQENKESKNEDIPPDFEIGQTVQVVAGIYQGNKLEVLGIGFERLKLKFGNKEVSVAIADVAALAPPLPDPDLFIVGTGKHRKKKIDYSSLVGKRVRIASLGGELCDVVALSTSPDKPIIWQSVNNPSRKGFANLTDLE